MRGVALRRSGGADCRAIAAGTGAYILHCGRDHDRGVPHTVLRFVRPANIGDPGDKADSGQGKVMFSVVGTEGSVAPPGEVPYNPCLRFPIGPGESWR